MEKGQKKPTRTDVSPRQRPTSSKPRLEKQTDKGNQDNVESSELTLDELEPRVAPRSIGTFF